MMIRGKAFSLSRQRLASTCSFQKQIYNIQSKNTQNRLRAKAAGIIETQCSVGIGSRKAET